MSMVECQFLQLNLVIRAGTEPGEGWVGFKRQFEEESMKQSWKPN